MAEILLSGGVIGMTGQIANMIFTMRNGRCYSRSVPPMVSDPKSDNQIASRNRFITVVNRWDTLTDIVKSAWSAAVALLPSRPIVGTSKSWFTRPYNDISAYNYYCSVNTLLLACGMVLTDVPPAPSALPDFDTPLGIIFAPVTYDFGFTGGYNADTLVPGTYCLQIRGRSRHQASQKYDTVLAIQLVIPGTGVDFSLIPHQNLWRIGTGTDIRDVDLQLLEADDYQFRAELVSMTGQTTAETSDIFVTSVGGALVPLVMASILPITGPLLGLNLVDLGGFGFTMATTFQVRSGILPAVGMTGVTILTPETARATMPASPEPLGGLVDIVAQRGLDESILVDGYTYV